MLGQTQVTDQLNNISQNSDFLSNWLNTQYPGRQKPTDRPKKHQKSKQSMHNKPSFRAYPSRNRTSFDADKQKIQQISFPLIGSVMEDQPSQGRYGRNYKENVKRNHKGRQSMPAIHSMQKEIEKQLTNWVKIHAKGMKDKYEDKVSYQSEKKAKTIQRQSCVLNKNNIIKRRSNQNSRVSIVAQSCADSIDTLLLKALSSQFK